jgi:hypothetical protein
MGASGGSPGEPSLAYTPARREQAPGRAATGRATAAVHRHEDPEAVADRGAFTGTDVVYLMVLT